MDLLLLHLILLVWLAAGAARRATDHPADLLLAAAALAWVNLLLTAVVLSPLRLLGEPGMFLSVSTGLGLAGLLLARYLPRPANAAPAGKSADPRLLVAAAATLVPLGAASALTAISYLPDSPAAYAYELPRALQQVAQGSILPLQVADARQVLLPFNFGVLHTWLLAFGTPLPVLGALNVLAWVLAGLAVNRLCRAAGWSANAALAAAWCTLVATPVLAHAATTDNGLPAATALVAGLSFVLTWRNTGHPAPAALGGLLLGLAAGSSPGACLIVLALGIAGIVTRIVPPGHPGGRLLGLGLAPGLLPLALNLVLVRDVQFSSLFAIDQATSAHTPLLRLGLLLPLWRNPGLFDGPSEDTVGLGLPGLACLLAAGWLLVRLRPAHRVTFVLAAMAFAWLALILTAGRWFAAGSSELVPVLLLAAPALAALVDRWAPTSRTVLVAGLAIAAAGLWSAQLYLWHNARRPLGPLLNPKLALARPSLLPPQLENRLARADLINFVAEGQDPLLLALMRQRPEQHFETRGEHLATAYNVFSRPSIGHNRPLAELADGSAYLLVPFPGKPTAGVEFLGSASLGSQRRDYFGLDGLSKRTPPDTGNQLLLVTIAAVEPDDGDPSLRLDLKGLDPRDQASLEVWGDLPGGDRQRLAAFTTAGNAIVPRSVQLERLHLRLVSTANGQELETINLDATRAPEVRAPEAPDPKRTFSAELVSITPAPGVRSSEGLSAAEGPYPTWNLPLIRWSRTANLTLQVSVPPDTARVRLTLSARLHLRTEANLEVVANGEVAGRLEFDDPLHWRELEVEFEARPGVNTVELRDAPLAPVPDWVAYLERYPDVKRHVEINRQSPKAGALAHYQFAGKAEGREMHFLPPPRLAQDAYRFMFRRLHVEGFRP